MCSSEGGGSCHVTAVLYLYDKVHICIISAAYPDVVIMACCLMQLLRLEHVSGVCPCVTRLCDGKYLK